jgi:hypothetical protein
MEDVLDLYAEAEDPLRPLHVVPGVVQLDGLRQASARARPLRHGR